MTVDQDAVCDECGGGVYPENRRVTRCVDVRLCAVAIDSIPHPVEEKCFPQKLEQLSFSGARYVRLEVEEVEIRLMVDFLAFRSRHLVQLLEYV